MKTNQIRTKSLIPLQLLGFITISLFLFSCEKDEQNLTGLTQAQSEKLECHGFNPANAEFVNGQYLIDKCYYIDESHFNSSIDENFDKLLDVNKTGIGTDEIQLRQYATYGENTVKVSMNKVNTIKFYVDPEMYNSNNNSKYWSQAISQAIVYYQGLQQCRISFLVATSPSEADLIFFLTTSINLKPMYWLQYSLGQGCFPKNGNVGRYIGINPGYYTNQNKLRIIKHELGHNLGLRHTCISENFNVTDNNVCNTTVGQYIINGTPESDCGSIMKPDAPNNLDLNDNDKKSFRYLYPDSYNTPTLSSLTKFYSNGWKVKVKTSNLPSPQIPYRIVISRYATGAPSPSQSYYYYEPSNNLKEFNVSVPSGTWVFKVWYLNHGNYGVGSNTMQITI